MRRAAVPWGPVTIAALLAGLVSSLAARTVAAADCATLPTPVYVTGSTAAKPLLAEIGKLMAGQSPPTTVVYLGQGSCTGVDAILAGTSVVGSGTGALSYWDSAGVELKCDVAAPGVVAQVGISDVFATTCFQLPGGLPTSVARHPRAGSGDDVRRPQDVGRARDQRRGGLLHLRFRRAVAGAALDVRGADLPARRAVRNAAHDRRRHRRSGRTLEGNRARRRAAISLMRLGDGRTFPISRSASCRRRSPRTTARRSRSWRISTSARRCAVFPDSDEASNDKVNVRNGLYPIWGPLHLFARVNASGTPTNAKAGEVDRLPRGHAPDAGGRRPDQARGAAPRDTPVRDARQAHAGDGADDAVCARQRLRLLLREGRDRRHPVQAVRNVGGVPGQRARLQLRILRAAVGASPSAQRGSRAVR